VIVGAGLAGLTCAVELTRRGIDCRVLEASDRPGGRVASDHVDGFVVDRGFQILLTAYPEVQRTLDLDALDLQRFEPGAVVRVDGRFARVADPLRRPTALVQSATAPIGSVLDKLRFARETLSVRTGPAAGLLRRPDRTTREAMAAAGFSDRMVERFLRPLFSGIGLDPDLEVSSRRYQLILRMLAVGDAAVPADGMGAIGVQLAARLPEGTLALGCPVDRIDGTTVHTAGGEHVDAAAVVVATEAPAAHRLLGTVVDPGRRSVAAVWFSCDESPLPGRALVLDGEHSGPVANLAVMSQVAPGYAPPGRHVVVGAMPIGRTTEPVAVAPLVDAARSQLRGWFGGAVDRWDVLAAQAVDYGHPDQRPGFSPKQRVDLGAGRFVCGDHRDTASIQGAMYSGRRTAAAVLARLGASPGAS